MHIDFLHTFHDVEYALGAYMYLKVGIVHPTHHSQRALMAAACCRENATTLEVVLQSCVPCLI